MSSKNDITGDTIATKASTETYRNNYDAIFGKKKKTVCPVCHVGEMVYETRIVTTTTDGTLIPPTEITADWCNHCSEAVMDENNADKYSRAISGAHKTDK